MEQKLDIHLVNLLDVTIRLEQAVKEDASDSSEWMDLLEIREELIGQIKEYNLLEGAMSQVHRDQLTRVHDINQGLITLIEEKKSGVQEKLVKIQRSKQAMNSYIEAGPNGYGAFFDRKK